jgi:hypothetical protein
MIKACIFTSIWDGEETVISTPAKINLSTGRIFDIGQASSLNKDGVEIESLDRQYIEFDDVPGKFDINDRFADMCHVSNLNEVIAALQPTSTGSF